MFYWLGILAAILASTSLSSDGSGDARLARDLLESADIGNRDLWRVLWTWQTGASGCGRLGIRDLFSIIKEKAPHDALATFIDITDPSNTKVFDGLVSDFGDNSPDDLRRILTVKPAISQGALKNLLKTVSSPDVIPLLLAAGLCIDSESVATTLINRVGEENSPALASLIVKTKSDFQDYIFTGLICAWGTASPGNMQCLMQAVADDPALRKPLNDAFILLKDADMLGVLLDAGADPEYQGGEALFQAALRNDAAAIHLLLPRISLGKLGENILTRLRPYARQVEPSLLRQIEAAVWEAAPDSGATQYARVDDVTLSEVKNLPHGLRLTTVFNFERREETQIVQKTEGDAALAVSARSFSALDDVHDLEGLRQKLIDLKGDPPRLNITRHKDRIKIIPT